MHASAYAGQEEQGLLDGPYRPTRRLAPRESATLEVRADDCWNETGLYLEAGLHRFTAEGSWCSATFESGPAGGTGGRLLRPRAIGQLGGTLVGRAEEVYRRLIGNCAADFYGARREETLPWMSLVGVLANEVSNVPPQHARPHERIAIGAGVEHDVVRPGYLYAFANDAWGFCGNNSGRVRLTVTRV